MSGSKDAPAGGPLAPGTPAPDFKLRSTPDQLVSLCDFRGAPVILAFYPADWSPVCGDQMALYNQILPEFHRLKAQMVGISVDGAWCHAAFAKDRNLHFPLLADFEPKGELARKYGVYRPQDGICERALFVIDSAGVIAWSYVSPAE
jgi:peroxiredoxin